MKNSSSTFPGRESSRNKICVVHLVRKKNGIEHFKAFIASYQKYKSGTPHDLLIIFKGFKCRSGMDEYYALLSNIPFKKMFLYDFGFDIRSYFEAAKRNDYDYFFFMNSYSRICADQWLKKVFRCFADPSVGVVGCTGSYESLLTDINFPVYEYEPGGPPRRSPRSSPSGVYHQFLVFKPLKNFISRARGFISMIKARILIAYYARNYAPFPNYHIRSNAFMISKKLMGLLEHPLPLFKQQAHKFESGKSSLTKQVCKLGYKALIVGKNGRSYKMEEWHRSFTFRRGLQGNLIVSDNQTMMYMNADEKEKKRLSTISWNKGGNI